MNSADRTHDDRYTPILPVGAWLAAVEERVGFLAEAHNRLQRLLDQVADREITARALSHALDGAALETGAIEGLYRSSSGITISVIDGSIDLAVAEAEIADSSEVAALIAGQRMAYDLALDIATSSQPFSEAIIREIHQTTCAGQRSYRVQTDMGPQDNPLPKGTYKHHANHVKLPDGSVHAYCPVIDVPAEMARFVEEISAPPFRTASPAAQAAYLHHSLTHIHPFADGNGRTARVVASIPLLRAYSVPFVVFADRDGLYRTTQAKADTGDTSGYVRFTEDSALDVISLVRTRIETDIKQRPDLRDLAARISQQTPDEPKLAAESLYQLLTSIGPAFAADFDLEETFGLRFQRDHATISTQGRGKQRSGSVHHLRISYVTGPQQIIKERDLSVLFDTIGDSNEPLQIGTGRNAFTARIDEVLPRPTSAVKARLEVWLEGVVLDLLTQLERDYS